MFTGKICVCSCVRFRFLSLTPLLTPTFHVVTRDVTLSQSQSNSPLPPIVDPQVGSATKLVPCFGKHPSIRAYSTNFIFQWPNYLQASNLANMDFSTLTFAGSEIHSSAIVSSARISQRYSCITRLLSHDLTIDRTNTTISVKAWSKPITTGLTHSNICYITIWIYISTS